MLNLSDDDLQNVIVHCDTTDVAHTVLRIETQQRHEGLQPGLARFAAKHRPRAAQYGALSIAPGLLRLLYRDKRHRDRYSGY